LTVATRESVKVIAAEMVKFPVPVAAGTLMVAGPLSVSSKVSDPLVPVVNEVVKALAASLLKVMEPTFWAASSVTVRFAVCAGLELLKTAAAPVALGMVAGFQLAAVFQLPPVARFQVCALTKDADTNEAKRTNVSRAVRRREAASLGNIDGG